MVRKLLVVETQAQPQLLGPPEIPNEIPRKGARYLRAPVLSGTEWHLLSLVDTENRICKYYGENAVERKMQ
jgi:hypothetical protein